MQIVEQSVEFDHPIDGHQILKDIERAGRTCYKSEDRITDDSADKFVKSLVDRDHLAMIEFGDVTLRFITDRGVTHEIVRHRIASYAQESTRYCNYGKANEIVFIRPIEFSDPNFLASESNKLFIGEWERAMRNAESAYLNLVVAMGAQPQFARSVLPNSLKTEIVVKMNLREWRHFFSLRTAKAAHPQMRALAQSALDLCKSEIPVIFDDL